MRKKGQLSIFIIIGIILIISIILFLFIKSRIQHQVIAPGVTSVVDTVPNQFLPVQTYVEDCLARTAKDALVYAGQHGGYLYFDRLNPSAKSTESDSLIFAPRSKLYIPYWFYMSSPNQCENQCSFASKKPSLRKNIPYSIEEQSAKFINQNLLKCLSKFQPLIIQGFSVVEDALPNSELIVTEENVVVKLKYPLSISKVLQGRKNTVQLDNFYTSLDINLKRIYTSADYLTSLQRDYRFLEKAAKNILVGFSGKDKKKLPPMSDSSFEIGSKVRWTKSQVKNNVRNLLVSYIPMLSIENQGDLPSTDSLYQDDLFKYGFGIPANLTFEQEKVTFNYLDFWDMYFDINCEGETCEPESAFTDLLPIGMQRYNFAYDLSFPVLVEIYDPTAFHNTGYTFTFALEANLRNNQPMPANFVQATVSDSEGSFFCDEDKRTSGEIEISTKDQLTSNPVDSVDITYSCMESCFIGQTVNGLLRTTLPVCFGGTLTFRKDGYQTLYLDYDSQLQTPDKFEISLNPVKEVAFEVRKKPLIYESTGWVMSSEDKPLAPYESAIVSISSENENGETIFSLGEYTINGTKDTLRISQATYQIDVSVISDKEYFIPEGEKGIFGQSMHTPAFNTTALVTGSVSINYTFSKDEMQKNKLILYVLSPDLYSKPEKDRSIDDLDVITRLTDLNQFYYNSLLPRLE